MDSTLQASSITKPASPAAIGAALKTAEHRIELIPLANIHPSPTNPRKTFEGIEELAQSIAEQGLLQPILVRPMKKDGDFEIIAGARRFRALKHLKRETAPCKVIVADDGKARAVQIVENLQREDIGALEEAEAFKALQDLDPKIWTPLAIAKVIGKTDRFVQQRIAIAGGLTAPLKKKFAEGEVSVEVARTLAPLPTSLQRTLEGHWSVEQGDAAGLRRAIYENAIPLANAKFNEKLYNGEIVDDGKGKKYCLNIDQFHQLQTVEARKVLEGLKAEWPKAHMIETNDLKAWHWADEQYPAYSGLMHAERKDNKPIKYLVEKEKCTAVVWVANDGRIRIAHGACSAAAVNAAQAKRQQKRTASAGGAGPVARAITEPKARKEAREAFNDKLAAAIAKDENTRLRLQLLHLLDGDYPVQVDSKDLPKELRGVGVISVTGYGGQEDDDVPKAWAIIAKMPVGEVRKAITGALSRTVEWLDYQWKETPALVTEVAKALGVAVPDKEEEKPAKAVGKAKPKAATKKAAAARKKHQ